MKRFEFNKKAFSKASFLVLALFFSLALTSCNEEDKVGSLWDPNYVPKAAPVVESLTPATEGLAGITNVVIKGQNFSIVTTENYVYFGKTIAKVISATPTELVVKAPNTPGNGLEVKVAVAKTLSFSNKVTYNLRSAVSTAFEFPVGETPYAIAMDKAGNIYYSHTKNNAKQGVKMMDASGNITDFAPAGGETFYISMKVGPDGNLYGVRNVKAIFLIKKGAAPTTYASSGLGSLLDIDWDQNKNIWAVGNNAQIYRIKAADKTIKAFDFNAESRAVRVYNGYLYIAGKKDGKEGVWRFKIIDDNTLGAVEEYVKDIDTKYLGKIAAITFDAEGTLYIGVSVVDKEKIDPILTYNPSEGLKALYEGVLNADGLGTFNSFVWGSGDEFYFIRQIVPNPTTAKKEKPETIVKVWMGKKSAPYYGL